MQVIERPVIRRMRLEEGNKENEWVAPVPFEKIARLHFQKLRLGKFEWQRCGKTQTEGTAFFLVRLQPFCPQKFCIAADAPALEPLFLFWFVAVHDRNPLLESALGN